METEPSELEKDICGRHFLFDDNCKNCRGFNTAVLSRITSFTVQLATVEAGSQ